MIIIYIFNSDYLSKYINLCPNEFNLKEIQSKCQQLNGRKSNTDGNHLFEKGNEKKLKIKSEEVMYSTDFEDFQIYFSSLFQI